MSVIIPTISYVAAIIADISLIFFAIFNIIAFDDLKTDFKDPIQQCKTLNPLVLPEYGLHLFFNLFFLICGEWLSFALNVPLMAYHFHRYTTRPVMSEFGIYDPTAILDRQMLTKCQIEGWVKLAFYLFSFFYYLYSMIYVLIYYS